MLAQDSHLLRSIRKTGEFVDLYLQVAAGDVNLPIFKLYWFLGICGCSDFRAKGGGGGGGGEGKNKSKLHQLSLNFV